MPISFVPRDSQIYTPQTGAIRDAWNEAYKAYGKDPGALLSNFREFEEGEIAQVEGGRVELNANEVISQALKFPAYSIEAPLRPLNVATGGAVENVLGGAWQAGKNIPILGLAFNALEGVGGVLEASNKAGRAFVNNSLANWLLEAEGKPDDFVIQSAPGRRITAGWVRKEAIERWGVHPETGERFTLAQLTARAKRNTWDFGEFDVSSNGFSNFVTQVLVDPLNVALLGGGTAIGLAGKALRAATWARPAVNFGTRMAGAPRIGYGALKSLGRAVVETPTGAKFLDEMSAAREIIGGNLASHGTLAGLLRASSWMMRGLYMPGYASSVARGMNPVRAGAVAWQRGGIQQMAATTAAEQVSAVANGWVVDAGLENTVVDGFTSWMHDTMNAINNDHPLSDNDAFTIVALFSPWATAIGDVGRGIKEVRTRNGLPRYADNTLFHVKDEFRKMFNVKDDYNMILTKMGRGDADEGRRAWEWFVDQMEVLKASNQLSDYTRRVGELEDLAARAQFLTPVAVDKITTLRAKGALQPNSLADFMLDFYRDGPISKGGDRLAHQFEITADGFYSFVNNLYRSNRDFAPQLEKLAGLQVQQGAPITREILEGIMSDLNKLPDNELISREFASRIMEVGPSLVWESEFFQRFSQTLGQRQLSGKFKRPDTLAENVTVGKLKEQVASLMDSAPPASELYHEAAAASKKAVRVKPGQTMLSEPPYPMPTKLAARRVYSTGRVRQLIDADRKITDIRNAEFFKNGKPRLQAAKEMVGHEGGYFTRIDTPSGPRMVRDDGVGFTVQDGILKADAIDSEILVLGVQNGGRVAVRPVSDGPLMAQHGFVEVARVKGSDLASYAYRGGDTTKIIENFKAGAFRQYKPAKKEASQNGAINAARRSANDASLIYPSMDGIRPSVTKTDRHAVPEERLKELQAIQDSIRAQRKSLIKQISQSDETALQLAGINTKVAKLGDWFDHASRTEINDAISLIRDANKEFPTLTVREGQALWVDPRADRFSMLLTKRNLYRRMAFEYGHLSPISYLYNALLAPVNARWLGKQTQTEVHNLLAQSGYTAKESSQFVAQLRELVIKSRSTQGLGGKIGTHLFRSVQAIPDGFVQDALEKAAPGKAKEVLERWGSGQKMLTEAGNRLLRNSSRRARSGGKVDPLSAAVNSAFRIWQYSPGLEYLSSSTRHFAKFMYPLLRFSTDPLYLTMNLLEPDMYGISMEGAKASRWSGGIVSRRQSSQAAEQASLTSIPPGGLRDADLPVDLLLADPGAYTMPFNIRPVLERHFDIKRLSSTEDAFRALKNEDPIAVLMREHFGDDVADWAKAADEMLYGYTTRGPDVTVRETAQKMLDDMNLTKEEAKAIAPMMEKLASMHRGHYSDLVQLYVGRLNRPGIERVLDHFFLFWPLSYQIKATKWLATIMFQRIGGVNAGAGGAYLWDEYRQRWEDAVAQDAELDNWVKDNEMFTFMLEMMFPMTPMGIGVSVSRPTRYVGSWIADGLEVPQDIRAAIAPSYQDDEQFNVPDMLLNSSRIGPVRTFNMFRRILNDFEVPGFTYENTTTPVAPGDILPTR